MAKVLENMLIDFQDEVVNTLIEKAKNLNNLITSKLTLDDNNVQNSNKNTNH